MAIGIYLAGLALGIAPSEVMVPPANRPLATAGA